MDKCVLEAGSCGDFLRNRQFPAGDAQAWTEFDEEGGNDGRQNGIEDEGNPKKDIIVPLPTRSENGVYVELL